VQAVIKAVKAGDWELVDGAPVAAGVTLAEGEYELRLVAADVEHSAPLPGGEGVVVLDTVVTPELAAEGLARDVVRVVQQARRDADLDVSDRIVVSVSASEEVRAAVAAFSDFVAREVLADSVDFAEGVDGFAGEVGEGDRVTVVVRRV
jgi:isoleucyl-tRNA synthetase